MTLANYVTEVWAELLEVKGTWSVVYCRFFAAKWLNIGVCICLTGVCWMQVYFTANVGRKFRDSSCFPVNRGCPLNMGLLNIGFKYSELLAKLSYLPPSCEDPQILYIFCHHKWTVLWRIDFIDVQKQYMWNLSTNWLAWGQRKVTVAESQERQLLQRGGGCRGVAIMGR